MGVCEEEKLIVGYRVLQTVGDVEYWDGADGIQ